MGALISFFHCYILSSVFLFFFGVNCCVYVGSVLCVGGACLILLGERVSLFGALMASLS
jgi:hypothetical protein